MSPSRIEVDQALERVLSSSMFAGTGRQSHFLRFVVRKTVEGEALKESLVGVEVYGRGADYDPKIDSIVRVEAGRLRTRLAQYYSGPGQNDPIRIDLPRGGYVAHFEARAPHNEEKTEAPRVEPRWRIGAALAAVP